MTDPRILAYLAVDSVMQKGSAKDGRNDSWKGKEYHIDKGIRHAISYRLVKEGHAEPDGETHLENAITRFAMELCRNPEAVRRLMEHMPIDISR